MNKWLEKYSNGDIVQQNYNDVSVSLPEGFVGMGYNTKGRNYSPAWGGQFAMGGSLPGSVGFTYARTNNPAPSNGKYAKKTMPSAQDGWVTKAANAEFSCAANPRSNLNQSYSEYCNPKKGLDKDEYEALKKELSSGSMKDLLNVEEYYVLKNLADNQNRKMGRKKTEPDGSVIPDDAYSKYFDQSTGLPIPNLTNELKEEGNLRATNRMYPGRKNLLVNDVYQGILKDYNITTPQTPAQTKALLEKAYNIGYAIPKQQDGGMTYYQNGLDWKPKSMEEGGWLNQYEVPKNQNAEYKLPSITKPREASESTANTFYNPITKKIVNTATTGQTKENLEASTRAMGKTRKRDIEEEKQRVAERKSAVATKDKGKPFTLPTGETKAYKDMDWREKAYVSGKALENRGRFFENEESIIDDINPISWITDIAGGLGKAPLEARDYDSNLPYVAAILDPLIQGRMGFNPLGSAINTGKKIGSKVAQSIESGALSKAYKYNPFAFKANPEAYYRGIGKQGAEDALKTGVFRQAGVESGTPNFQKVWYATGDKGFERASAFSDGYVAQVPKTSFSDLDFLKNSMGVETRATSKHIPINEGNILKRDWLKGYKEVPRKEEGGELAPYEGYSVVDFLAVQNQPYDYKSRKELATSMGIENYRGKAKQNLDLINRIKENPNVLGISKPAAAPEQEFKIGFTPEEFIPAPMDEEISYGQFTPQQLALTYIDEIGRTPIKPKSATPITKSTSFNELLAKQAYKESTFRPDIVNKKGYKGLAQLGDAAIQDYKRVTGDKNVDPLNPKDAVKVQQFLMNDLYNSKFINVPGQSENVRMAKTLAAYNWGRGNVSKFLNRMQEKGVDVYKSMDWINQLPKETEDYINKVLLNKDEKFNKEYERAISSPKNKTIRQLYNVNTFETGGWLNKQKDGGIIKDDMGQWAHPGEITEIGSNQITMQGVPYPVLGISDTGDTQMMYPEEEYEFDGTKVTEYPMAKNGVRQEQKGLQNLDDLLNFTNYNKPQPGGWLNKYN